MRARNPNASGNKNRGPAHNRFKHGMTGTRTYKSWTGMKARCLNAECDDYPNYGGRASPFVIGGLTSRLLSPTWANARKG